MPSVRGQAHASGGALEGGGPPVEGGADPRARQSPLEGERSLERGGVRLREAHPLERDGARPEGGAHLRARRSLFEGIFEGATLMGR
jgi:hypothetical protein